MARFVSMAQTALGRLTGAGGPSYTALPVEGSASPRISEKTHHGSNASDTDSATRLKVFASVSFYLVAALVVRVAHFISALIHKTDPAFRSSPADGDGQQ